MAHPMRVTFPGTVRFAPPPADAEERKSFQSADSLRTTMKHDEKGKFVGTVVTVPPGKRLTWPEPKTAPAFGGNAKPVYLLSLVDDEPVHAHAELEHEVTPAVPATPSTIGRPSAMGKEREGKPATAGTPAVFGMVTARSVDGKVSATGKDAAEAVANLKAAMAAKPEAPAEEPAVEVEEHELVVREG